MARIISEPLKAVTVIERKMTNAYMMYKKCKSLKRQGLANMYRQNYYELNRQRKLFNRTNHTTDDDNHEG